MTQRFRQNQIALLDSFGDQLTAAEVQAIESAASNLEEYFDAILSQLKRIMHGDAAGDYKDDPATVFGQDASLKGLLTRADFDEDKIVVARNSEVVVSRSGYVVRTRYDVP